jgi:antitoxin component YwqK of YwqJK toxin-antitoxin module
MQTLNTDDKDIEYRNEYNLLVDVYYKGEKFTGILKDEWEQTGYKEGLVHGESISFFKSGKVREISSYKHGEHLKTTKLFENGVLNSEMVFEPYSYKVWNINSTLVRENNIFYYTNGNIRKVFGDNRFDNFIMKGYAKNTQLMYTVEKDVWIDNKIVRNVTYEDNVLFDCYFDSLIEENPELADTEEKNDTHQIWMWFWTIFDKDKSKYLDIVNKLMTHPSKEVIDTIANIIASHKYHKYIAKETNENTECYKLIKEQTIYQDKNFPNRQIKAF